MIAVDKCLVLQVHTKAGSDGLRHGKTCEKYNGDVVQDFAVSLMDCSRSSQRQKLISNSDELHASDDSYVLGDFLFAGSHELFLGVHFIEVSLFFRFLLLLGVSS